jgi:transcriptional regulator with XRE-family HTH domain
MTRCARARCYAARAPRPTRKVVVTRTRQPHSVAALVRRYRITAGLSQEALAERAGLSARGLSDLERGLSRVPRLDTLTRIADALELDAAARETLVEASGRLDPLRGTMMRSASRRRRS